jgi:predicted kinase
VPVTATVEPRLVSYRRRVRLGAGDGRRGCVDLAANYGAHIDLIAVEAPPQVLRARNSARTRPVPDRVIERLINRWQTPDPTEAHHVAWIPTT